MSRAVLGVSVGPSPRAASAAVVIPVAETVQGLAADVMVAVTVSTARPDELVAKLAALARQVTGKAGSSPLVGVLDAGAGRSVASALRAAGVEVVAAVPTSTPPPDPYQPDPAGGVESWALPATLLDDLRTALEWGRGAGPGTLLRLAKGLADGPQIAADLGQLRWHESATGRLTLRGDAASEANHSAAVAVAVAYAVAQMETGRPEEWIPPPGWAGDGPMRRPGLGDTMEPTSSRLLHNRGQPGWGDRTAAGEPMRQHPYR